MESELPPRGRQAEAARNDRLVLEAALEVFGREGFGAPISAVARQAGVGVGTLYRRYGSKEELLQHLCVVSMRQTLEAAQQGLLADTGWDGLRHFILASVGLSTGSFAPVAGRMAATDEMWQLAQESIGSVQELVGRAHAEGTLRRDANVTDVFGLIEHLSRAAPPGASGIQESLRRRQLAIALSGLSAPGAEPLPGPQLTVEEYQARWGDPEPGGEPNAGAPA